MREDAAHFRNNHDALSHRSTPITNFTVHRFCYSNQIQIWRKIRFHINVESIIK